MYFCTYWLRKRWLDKCLKSLAWEDPLTSNMVNGPKHCSKLNGRTFTIIIDRCEGERGWKSLLDWYAESLGCLLTHWLLITSILFWKETIYSNTFRCNYLRNEKCFLNFFFHFLNLNSILNSFKKKVTIIVDVFLNLQTAKNVVR